LRHEGGYVNNPNDPGGATNYGISLRFLKDLKARNHGHLPGHLDHPGDVSIYDIQTLAVDDAKKIYEEQWWDRYNFGLINDQGIATKVLDIAVNTGAGRAALLVQEAINELRRTKAVEEDGRFGPCTITAINDCDPKFLYPVIQNTQANFYKALYNADPNQNAEFISGWLNRAYDRA